MKAVYLLILSTVFLTACKTSDRVDMSRAVQVNSEVDETHDARYQDIADTARTAKAVPDTPEPVQTGLDRIEIASGKVGNERPELLESSRLGEAQKLTQATQTAKVKRAEEHAAQMAKLQSQHDAALAKASGERSDRLSRIFTYIAAGLCLSGVGLIGLGIWTRAGRLLTIGGIAFAGGILMGAAGLVIDHWLMPWVVWGSVVISIGAGLWIGIDYALTLRKKARLDLLQDSQVPALDRIKERYPDAWKEIRPILKRARRMDPAAEIEVAKRQKTPA